MYTSVLEIWRSVACFHSFNNDTSHSITNIHLHTSKLMRHSLRGTLREVAPVLNFVLRI
jgi:hypothetical protein